MKAIEARLLLALIAGCGFVMGEARWLGRWAERRLAQIEGRP